MLVYLGKESDDILNQEVDGRENYHSFQNEGSREGRSLEIGSRSGDSCEGRSLKVGSQSSDSQNRGSRD